MNLQSFKYLDTKTIGKLQNPLFICSVLLLLLNDFYFKYAYANWLTGKISDFAGLFAFPYFISCFLPRYKKNIHAFTVLLFIFWKSIYSQPVIQFINEIGIPVSRVVDYTDNIALVCVGLSFLVFSKYTPPERFDFRLVYPLIIVTAFSFMATSMSRHSSWITTDDNIYKFDISKNELANRINHLYANEIEKVNDGFGETIFFDPEKKEYYITIANTDSLKTEKDAMNKEIIACLIDTTSKTDTIKARNCLAEFMIYNDWLNAGGSVLKLSGVWYYPVMIGGKKIKKKEHIIKFFEERFINKLR
ncbi:hypothetical protein [Dysgonomonas sp. 216]|uniref:hypothetical protein n=1 Tax=Dysgonomonas sp. 216 TaxID=2302934 RepID=UPI0013D37460|nr:hypothetical protein [Dysgonomonas sp. 216]